MIAPALLDTDILSALMRGHAEATSRARAYLREHGNLTFSVITRFEILRGLKAKDAFAQVRAFDSFCASCLVMPLTEDIIVRGADIYGALYRKGKLISDADILIAATALVRNLTMVANNCDHFTRVTGLRVENWLK